MSQTGRGPDRPANRPAGDAGPGRLPARPGRRRGWLRAALTTTAAVAVGVVGSLVAVGALRPATPEPARPAVLARAPLTAYGTTPPTAHGDARVFRDGRLHLHVSGLPKVPGYYEVWLISPADMRMFSVGVLGSGADALLPLPPNVDLRTYSVVDISAEGYDNNTAHSGDSLLRGTLTS